MYCYKISLKIKLLYYLDARSENILNTKNMKFNEFNLIK